MSHNAKYYINMLVKIFEMVFGICIYKCSKKDAEIPDSPLRDIVDELGE